MDTKQSALRHGLALGIATFAIAAGITFATTAAAQGPTRTEPDFNGDGYADLTIPAANDKGGAGGVNVLYGSDAGLTTTGAQLWNQGSAGVQGLLESLDALFEALRLFAGPPSQRFVHQAAGLAVLCYLFERCELFEP